MIAMRGRSGTDSTDGFGTKGTIYINAVAKAFADADAEVVS